jgi:hypothetical protein
LAAWNVLASSGKLDSAAGSDGLLSPKDLGTFRFNVSDTYAKTDKGFSWEYGSRTITIPSGETEKGGRYFFPGDPDPSVSSNKTDEQRFYFPEVSEFYLKRRIFIPANFYIRNIKYLTMSTSIAGWVAGDIARGSDGASVGTISFISGSTVCLDYADNDLSNSIWTGTITNVTRGATATSTSRNFYDNSNKHLVLYSDGYSSGGKSPTIIFGWRGKTKTGIVDMDCSIAVDGSGSGQQPNTQIGAVNFLTAADNGKWLNIVYRVKMSTNESTNDGVIEVWRKRDDEPAYVKKLSSLTLNLGARSAASPALCKFKAGYSFGWANSGFNSDTTFNEAEFIMSTGNVFGVV